MSGDKETSPRSPQPEASGPNDAEPGGSVPEPDVPQLDRGDSEMQAADGNSAAVDEDFAAFLSEVRGLPRVTASAPRSGMITSATEVEMQAKLLSAFEVNTVTVEWGTGKEQVERILKNRYTASHFELFMLPPYATEELIKKHFRRLSVLIHPDKCDHPEAAEAFFMLTKAYEELLKPEFRAQYADVIEEAKEAVLRDRKRENKARRQKGEELLGTDDDAIRLETIAKCDAIVKDREERLAYAERTKRQNQLREQRLEAEAQAEECRRQAERRKWAENRDQRVDVWREVRHTVLKKKLRPQESEKKDDYRRSWR